ncbi:UMF1 family MFS transporter [Sagittula marina]|uniref:UMF1 family MFS transporter n=1 Tax=Sagittula marina TaxID=943940 RepID=A0A7W6DRG8_9RHOB|nr:MFS transporter [Sagittula marina]MBB3983819.1 UMF1 family MFS transporter [Sagittula marina]
MTDISRKKRIWGWMFFDWAQQPYATLGLTFIFAPYFAAVAADYFREVGQADQIARASAQSLWSSAQTIAGLAIAFSAPFLGAWADTSGRKLPWIKVFTALAILCAAFIWLLQPDGTGLFMALAAFWIGFVFSESAFNLNNGLLPSLGSPAEIGRISGGSTAFGYWGGVLSLFIILLFFAENETGKTLIGLSPAFGLDPETREGTRFVGPFIALWFALFTIPYLLTIREPRVTRSDVSVRTMLRDLKSSVRAISKRRSASAFLLGSMFYRDALSALYAYGGVYATLVLDWSTPQVGVFGIIAAIAAALLSWLGGIADQRRGPKPVITFAIWSLIVVCTIIVGMSREHLFFIALPAGSLIPDITFYICGAVIGGAGGALYASSRSLMVRHADPDRPAEAFGLFALTGKATAFLAPALITLFTLLTQSNQLGFLPVIFLFLLGLTLLRWVQPEGDLTT